MEGLYNIYHGDKLVASLTSWEAYKSTIRMLRSDPANDGPEVNIINRENQIKVEESICRHGVWMGQYCNGCGY